ncbi:MAG: hypothetical protein AW10_01208 [Candidatus Accumulibacter appositus]|uniref:Uncharacterized protein n=1 Tax=Candidatus Accumulibacter appositus TaxID=1454003 RepID=A0A011P173_9PROT|nr:MAG: hypothetical protein AW10_01208 [Candidatus Accumulibacter appositus]
MWGCDIRNSYERLLPIKQIRLSGEWLRIQLVNMLDKSIAP